MPGLEIHDRAYMRSRVREEMARARRYNRPFAVVTFEAIPVSDGIPIRKKIEYALHIIDEKVRPSDVVARVFDDMVAVLFVETDAHGANDALMRLRNRLLGSGHWEIIIYLFPNDEASMEAMPLLHAA